MVTIKQKRAIANLVTNGGNVSKAMRDAGYSKNTARDPARLTKSAGGGEVLKTVIEKMEAERDRILLALANKDLDQEKYSTLVDGMDKMVKNTQLLNGGATERRALAINFDDAFKK